MAVNNKEDEDALEIQKLKKDPKVERALRESSRNKEDKKIVVDTKKQVPLLGLTALIFVGCGVLYFLFGWKYFPIRNPYIPLIQKAFLGTMLTSLILTINRIVKKILSNNVDNATVLFNLKRIGDLIAGLFIFIVILSLLFANWYAAMVSFGIISLVLGLALQNPISSFFAWMFILVRKPYEVGDRIRIGNVKGDVIDLGYFDTILWEFNGEYLSGDHPSGRIVKFANSKVFSEFVYNYSWPLFPFIWNEVKIFVSYESDLAFVSEKVQTLVEEEVGEAMLRRVKRFKKILVETPIDQLEVREHPSIILRANENMWVEVVARYLVEPKKSGQVKNNIFKSVMDELRKHPDKVTFPKTDT